MRTTRIALNLQLLLALGLAACGTAHPTAVDFDGGVASPDAALQQTDAAPAKDVAAAEVAESLPDPVAQPFPMVSVPDASHLPALSGGTLAVTPSDKYVIAADSLRDAVFIQSLDEFFDQQTLPKPATRVILPPQSEPGRVVTGPDGVAYVALRRGGGVATIDYASAKLLEVRAVCAEPRGLAYDAKKTLLWIACASGELVQLPDQAQKPSDVTFVADDLRDLVLDGDSLWISRFRSAEIWQRDAKGQIALATKPLKTSQTSNFALTTHFSPAVAWRMIGLPSHQLAMVHQRGSDDPIDVTSPTVPYYAGSGSVSGIVGATISSMVLPNPSANGGALPPQITSEANFCSVRLPIDVAVGPQGKFAIADPSTGSISIVTVSVESGGCLDKVMVPFLGVTAVAYTSVGRLIAQSTSGRLVAYLGGGASDPSLSWSVQLNVAPINSPGHALFHTATKAGIACANCHPEGREDGRIWTFTGEGPRRTQAVWGGIQKTAPLHWNGQFSELGDLVAEVFTRRMAGDVVKPETLLALGAWLDALPVPVRQTQDPALVAKGKELFHSATTACATCHSGEHYTNNQNMDVGSGAVVQTPSLVGVGARLPLMHDGCAQSLHDRFGACGGTKHGDVSGLSATDVDALVAFMATL